MKNSVRVFFVILGVVMASLVVTCGGKTGLLLTEPETGPPLIPTEPELEFECISNSDCEPCSVCTEGICIVDPECCVTDADCAEGLVCNPETQRCVECLTDAQCADATICTTDLCEGNVCIHTPVDACCDSNADCDDGDVCTIDTCEVKTGICNYVPVEGCCNYDYECDDEDGCTTDVCVEHLCEHTPCPLGLVCKEDHSVCCLPYVVREAVTAGGPDSNPFVCPDVPCCYGECYEGICQCISLGNACSVDQDCCGEGSQCVDGVCRGCGDGVCNLEENCITCDVDCVNMDTNVCTDDYCDPYSTAPLPDENGWIHVNNEAPCEDGNPCTLNDMCSDGECIGGPPPDPLCNFDKKDGCCAESCTAATDLDCICENDVECNDDFAQCWDGFCNSGTCDFRPAEQGTQCRAAADVCDLPAVCNGSDMFCPANPLKPQGTECRAVADVCDEAEYCNGESASCPEDAFKPEGTECRAAAGDCDEAEYCSGEGSACPDDVFKSDQEICREAVSDCDMTEYCTGEGADCPEDAFEESGTPCDDLKVCTIEDQCDGEGNCIGTEYCYDPPNSCYSSPGYCNELDECAYDQIEDCCLTDEDCAEPADPCKNPGICVDNVCQYTDKLCGADGDDCCPEFCWNERDSDCTTSCVESHPEECTCNLKGGSLVNEPKCEPNQDPMVQGNCCWGNSLCDGGDHCCLGSGALCSYFNSGKGDCCPNLNCVDPDPGDGIDMKYCQ